MCFIRIICMKFYRLLPLTVCVDWMPVIEFYRSSFQFCLIYTFELNLVNKSQHYRLNVHPVKTNRRPSHLDDTILSHFALKSYSSSDPTTVNYCSLPSRWTFRSTLHPSTTCPRRRLNSNRPANPSWQYVALPSTDTCRPCCVVHFPRALGSHSSIEPPRRPDCLPRPTTDGGAH